jgi:hypothetical protein
LPQKTLFASGFVMLNCINWRLSRTGERTTVSHRFLARTSLKVVILWGIALAAQGPATGSFAQGFKFSDQDPADKAKEEARSRSIAERLSTPCKAQLKNKKIMVVIGEQTSGGPISANQQNYGPHYEAINRRLRALGLRTNTPEEIRKQIAQAEIDAYFKGDPDAALAASRRYGASFVLRGLIEATAGVNQVVHVNEVTINMDFWLADSSGRPIGDATAHGESYAGSNVRGMAAKLIDEQADDVVSKLYSDYCENAAPARKK